jgi:ankyrin repeat protein
MLLENVFQGLKDETNTMDKQEYIPLLITFFQEITNGGKLCLPLRLEPIGFRLTWEMICAAKNDEKEVFAKLVQNAKELKNLLDNFIISIIDEENNSLLHYLVVWGYDAGIQLLEIESTWKTTLKNKQNFTPVHFAAYLGRHKFLELILKITENFQQSTYLQMLRYKPQEDSDIANLKSSLEAGEKKAEQDTPFNGFYIMVNEHLVSSLTCGTKSQYEDSRRVIENTFQIKFPSGKQSEIRGNH